MVENTALAALVAIASTLTVYLIKSFIPSQKETLTQAAGFAQELAKSALDGMRTSAEALHKMAIQIDELREESRLHARENRGHHQELLNSLAETKDAIVREFEQMEDKINGRKPGRSRPNSH